MSHADEGNDAQQLDIIYQLRGRFIAEVANVDDQLSFLLTIWFKPQDAVRVEFLYLLNKLSLRQKVEVFAHIAPKTEFYKLLVQAIQDLNKKRNDLAHTGVSPILGSDYSPQDYVSSKMTQSGKSVYFPMEPRALEEACEGAHWLSYVALTCVADDVLNSEGVADPDLTLDKVNARLSDGILGVSAKFIDLFREVDDITEMQPDKSQWVQW